MQATKLQILISTIGKRVEAIDAAGMPQVEGVEYLVICQNPEHLQLDVDFLQSRPDVQVHFFNDRKVSRNRNHGIDVATAEYILFSDDDISYNAQALGDLIATFDRNPQLDMVTTRSIIPELHVYPPDGHNLRRRFRFYSPICFEIALRRQRLVDSGVRFPETISIGTDYITCGEENFFYHHCLQAGFAGIYRDISVSEHRGTTTCTHSALKPGVIRAKGAFMACDRGALGAIIRVPLEAWRSPAPFFTALRYLLQGYRYYYRHRNEL